MAQKPSLTLVDIAWTPPAPPAELGERGRRLWRDVLAQFQIRDIGGLEVLRQTCNAADRAESCRKIIDEQGEMIVVKGQYKANPLLRDELANRAFVARSITRLGIDLEPLKAVGRPGGGKGG